MLLASLATACGKDEPATKPVLTQRQKDSILAQSTIPGAKAVNKALKTADSASARQYGIDSTEKP